ATCRPGRPLPHAPKKRNPPRRNMRPGRNRRSGLIAAVVQACSITQSQRVIGECNCREPCNKHSGYKGGRSKSANSIRTVRALLFLSAQRKRRPRLRDIVYEVVGRTVFFRPGRLRVFRPGVFALLAEEFLVDDTQQARYPHQIRQKKLASELRILDARRAALRT